ncbi:restriction endonuclease subunit S [Alcanivorax sp.]|uniref:restriction endonuclease subunit S n=1 Tax=Alcanivorax sp. TaxID=1872427 RepID=UPI0025B9970D|nr:restriction endonuclease subunit S [Alcanivorax sp.]MEE2603076.1 restriction endonuclease subunit S [Pseudomonadota bacterium]MEE3386632.1 restriction endonuclease subunit S [Pseudomonadota bacterium]
MSKVSPRRLGDLITLKRGYDLPEKDRVPGPYPVISSAGISGVHHDYKVEGPGVVTGRYGTLGEMYFVDGKYWPHNTALYVQNFKGNDPKYIYYLLSCLGRIRTSDKSAVPGVNRNELHEMAIPAIDDKKLQIAIRKVLEAIDQKIELNNRINAELEAMAKTLYDYWFVQFDFPDTNGKPYKTSGGKMVYNPTLKREIPEGWIDCLLGDHVTFKRGISYKSGDIQNAGVPFINLNSFSLSGEFKLEGTKYYNGKFKPESKLNPGELVIAITDVTRNADIIGKSFVIPDIFDETPLMSCDVASVSSRKFCNAYLEQLFNSESYHKYIKYYASGTLVLHLDLNGVKWFKTYLPPQKLLEEYSQHCASLFKQRNIVLKENVYLESLRDWLLPMLMNGQVTVGAQN